MSDAIAQWKEAVALAQKTGDYADVADAVAATQRAFPNTKTTTVEPECRALLLNLAENECADTAALRAAALGVLGRVGDTSPEVLHAAVRALGPRAPCTVVAAAQAYFDAVTVAHSSCAFAPVAAELRTAAAASPVVALRLAECVLTGQQHAPDAWHSDPTAALCVADLAHMLASPDVAVALNAIELVSAPARWDDARDAAASRVQLAALVPLASAATTSRLVRVAAVRALGGVAARGPQALAAAAELGVFELLERCVRSADDEGGGDSETAAAALCALAVALDAGGGAAVQTAVAHAPGIFDTVAVAADPAHGRGVRVAALHALASALRDATPAHSAMLRETVFAHLSEGAVAEAVRLCAGADAERAEAAARLLGAIAQHAWGAAALLACAPLAATLLARDHPHFGAADRCTLARTLLQHCPEIARTHPDLARLATHGPRSRPFQQPLVHIEP